MRIFVTILFFLIQHCCIAQTEDCSLYFRNYTEKNGLGSNRITCLLQDSKGFIWIGTVNGLNRFDGTEFKMFYSNPQQATAISGNIISAMAEDVAGNIWVATEGGGLSCYDPKTKKFKNYKHIGGNNNSLKENNLMSVFAKGNKIWVGYVNKGWSVLDVKTNTFSHFTSGEIFINRWQSNASNLIKGFTSDAKGNTWIISSHGLFKQTSDNKISSFFIKDKRYNAESNNLFTCIYNEGDSVLWIGTWAAGLKKFSLSTQTFTSYSYMPNNPLGGNRNIVLGISKKANNELWLATADKGIGSFNKTNTSFTFYPNDPTDDNSPLPRECRAVLTDNVNDLWAGFDKGLSVMQQRNQNFRFNNAEMQKPANVQELIPTAFYKDVATKKLFVGFEFSYGLQVRDERTSASKEIALSKNKQIISIFDIKNWNNDTILISSSVGMLLMHKHNYGFAPMMITRANKQEYIGVYDLHKGGRYYWTSDFNYSIIRLDPQTREVKRFVSPDPNSLVNKKTFFLHYESDSLCWLTERGAGLIKFNPQSLQTDTAFLQKGLSKIMDVKAIQKDSRGHCWVATFSSGLYEMWKGKNGKYNYKYYGAGEGLPDTYSTTLVADKNGKLWKTSKKGLVQFDPMNPVFKNFADADGYKEEWYYTSGIYISDDNVLYAGVVDGFVQSDINRFVLNQKVPDIVLKNFNVFDKPWNDSLNINYQKEIALNYDENFISFEFAALNFINPEQNKYAYKLEGIDENWIYTNRTFVSYSGLQPGTYRLKLKAANNDGVWNEKGIELKIIIEPPFWNTWWFILLIMSVGAALIVLVYRYRINLIRKEESLKTEFNKRVAEIEMKALRAQMNPHFIFNCLNSINRYIVKSDHITASGYLTKFAKLIRLILDNSSADTTTLDKEIQLLQLYIEMESLRFENRFSFSINVHTEASAETISIPSMLIQPYVENAIWHGLLHKEEKGKLQLSFITETKTNLLKVIIEDNGVGRKKAAQLKSKESLKEKSYGMKITGDRIRIVNELYDLKASSVIDDLGEKDHPLGTRVTLLLPYKNI